MKRSEMLNIMLNCAKQYDGFVGCDFRFVADKLLNAIEEAGMEPPTYYINDIHPSNN